jgi:hypothetical protein
MQRQSLLRVAQDGGPAQREQAHALLTRWDGGDDVSDEAAQLIAAFLHDPDLWR